MPFGGAPIFNENGPPFVVAPAAADLEIPSRVALLHESRAFNYRNRGHVARLDVCFKSMQFQICKRITKHQGHGFRHVALAREIGAYLITEIRALKSAANDLIKTDRTEYRAIGPATNKKPGSSICTASFEKSGKLFRPRWWRSESAIE